MEVEVSPPWIYKLLGVYISYPLSVSYPLPIHIRTLQETVWCARIGPEREPSVSNYGILGARGGHLAAPAARPPDGDSSRLRARLRRVHGTTTDYDQVRTSDSYHVSV